MINHYDYCNGEFKYLGINFEFETLDMENYQSNAVINILMQKLHLQEALKINILSLQSLQKLLLQENI